MLLFCKLLVCSEVWLGCQNQQSTDDHRADSALNTKASPLHYVMIKMLRNFDFIIPISQNMYYCTCIERDFGTVGNCNWFWKPTDDLETLTLEVKESRLEILSLIRIDNIDMKWNLIFVHTIFLRCFTLSVHHLCHWLSEVNFYRLILGPSPFLSLLLSCFYFSQKVQYQRYKFCIYQVS